VRLRAFPWLVLCGSLLVAFGVWRWAEHIAAPSNTAQALAEGIPIGNNSDLYARWLGTRELLLHGRDPYSAEMTREIQIGFYGRPLNPRNPSDPTFPESFVYPLYVVFLLAPTATLPFSAVQETLRWILLLSLACTVPLWMAALRFRVDRVLVLSGMVLAVSSAPGIMEYHQQNLAALVLLFLAGAAAACTRQWLGLSGFLLALATIKPELSGLTILWFLLWASASWSERQRLIWNFAGTMAALLIGAEMLSPHWIGRFLAALREYPTYGTDPSLLQLFLPSVLATLATAAVLGVLFVLCWRWRKAPAGSDNFGWALAWMGTCTLMVIPKLAAYNQPLLIPALLVVLARRHTIWQAGRLPRALAKGVFLCLIWLWGTALVLSFSSFLVPASRLRMLVHLPECVTFALSVLTFLAVVTATFSVAAPSPPTPPVGLPTAQTPA
jgi:hypothetical protein